MVFNCPVRQGYGLTETSSAASVGAFDSNEWSAGVPLSSTKLRLRDWPEGGYLLSDAAKPGVGRPRGEVLVGGPCGAPRAGRLARAGWLLLLQRNERREGGGVGWRLG